MPQLITISWRDIPSQVVAKSGRNRAKVQLSERFQKAIDRAAMKAGRQGSEAYLQDWQRTREVCERDGDAVVKNAAEQLEQRYTDEKLEKLVRSGGVDNESA